MEQKEIIKIELEFDSMKTFITGRNFATRVFEEQVKDNITSITGDNISEIHIRYPKNIKGVSISFTKQMISELSVSLGDDVYKKVKFITGSKKLTDKILEDIYF